MLAAGGDAAGAPDATTGIPVEASESAAGAATAVSTAESSVEAGRSGPTPPVSPNMLDGHLGLCFSPFKLCRLILYSTTKFYFLFGYDRRRTVCKILRLNRLPEGTVISPKPDTDTKDPHESPKREPDHVDVAAAACPALPPPPNQSYRHVPLRLDAGPPSQPPPSFPFGRQKPAPAPAPAPAGDDEANDPWLHATLKDVVYEYPGQYSPGVRGIGYSVLGCHEFMRHAQSIDIFLEDLNSPQHAEMFGTNLKLEAHAAALLGLVKFQREYYLILSLERQVLGSIGCHRVYGLQNVQLYSLRAPPVSRKGAMAWLLDLGKSQEDTSEAHYRSLFTLVDLSKDCFFSYTYDVTSPLQHTICGGVRAVSPPPKDMYIWNHYLIEELAAHVSSPWIHNVVYGSFQQRACALLARPFTMTLIGRRSRYFAGTRYLKRGVSDDGKTANDVEVEQIIDDHCGRFSSFVQVRASIPVFWSQETSVSQPKPPILLHSCDPTLVATKRHYLDLMTRYGAPILNLDLISKREKKPRETLIGRAFADAVRNLNRVLPPEARVQHLALDFKSIKRTHESAVAAMRDCAVWSLANTGYFVFNGQRAPITQLSVGEFRPEFRKAETRVVVARPPSYVEQMAAHLGEPLPVVPPTLIGATTNPGVSATVGTPAVLGVPPIPNFGSNKSLPSLIDTGSVALSVLPQPSPSGSAPGTAGVVAPSPTLSSSAPSTTVIPQADSPQTLAEVEAARRDAYEGAGRYDYVLFCGKFHTTRRGFVDRRQELVPKPQNLWVLPDKATDGMPRPAPYLCTDAATLVRRLRYWEHVNQQSKYIFVDAVGRQPLSLAALRARQDFPNIPGDDNVFLQQGVIRVNCVDCLDRTNAAQQWIGIIAMGRQLYSLGLVDSPILDVPGRISQLLTALYESLGDRIALQYGGSEAHKKGGAPSAEDQGRTIARSKLLTSIKRYYSNSFTDRMKQDAFNLFLGVYRPQLHELPLWDMESDVYLHCRGLAPDESAHPRQLRSNVLHALADWRSRMIGGPLTRAEKLLVSKFTQGGAPVAEQVFAENMISSFDDISDMRCYWPDGLAQAIQLPETTRRPPIFQWRSPNMLRLLQEIPVLTPTSTTSAPAFRDVVDSGLPRSRRPSAASVQTQAELEQPRPATPEVAVPEAEPSNATGSGSKAAARLLSTNEAALGAIPGHIAAGRPAAPESPPAAFDVADATAASGAAGVSASPPNAPGGPIMVPESELSGGHHSRSATEPHVRAVSAGMSTATIRQRARLFNPLNFWNRAKRGATPLPALTPDQPAEQATEADDQIPMHLLAYTDQVFPPPDLAALAVHEEDEDVYERYMAEFMDHAEDAKLVRMQQVRAGCTTYIENGEFKGLHRNRAALSFLPSMIESATDTGQLGSYMHQDLSGPCGWAVGTDASSLYSDSVDDGVVPMTDASNPGLIGPALNVGEL